MDTANHGDSQQFQQFLKDIEERNAGKVGQDPNRPYHPVFNPEPLAEVPTYRHPDQPPSAECTASQKAVWYEAIGLIREKRFSTRFALAQRYGRCEQWAENLVRAMVDQEVFTKQEVKQLIKSKRKGATSCQAQPE